MILLQEHGDNLTSLLNAGHSKVGGVTIGRDELASLLRTREHTRAREKESRRSKKRGGGEGEGGGGKEGRGGGRKERDMIMFVCGVCEC